MPAFSPTTSSCRTAGFRCLGLAVAALIATAFGAPLALADPAGYAGAAADGSVVFFTTTEELVPGDTDNSRRDVYARAFDEAVGEAGEYVTRLVSTGPVGGNGVFPAQYDGSSADGARVFFSTDERLVAADTDQATDVYVRDLSKGTTTLVSRGDTACAPACGNGASDAGFAGATPDGALVFFVTDERLAGGDTDSSVDIYMRDLAAESTVHVSVGDSSCAPGCGNGAFSAALRGVAPSGTRVFFVTAEQLSAADTDAATDIYARDLPNGPTVLVSRGDSSCAPACGNSGAVPVFHGSSDNGSRVFFTTDEQLDPVADTDSATDVYARDLPGGPTALVTAGVAQSVTANFAAASANGDHAFFTTTESLDAADTNGAADVYKWSGAGPSLVSSGTCCGSTFNASTADAATVVFTTAEPLSVADTDSSADIYVRAGAGAPLLASEGAASCAPGCGNGETPAIFSKGGLSSGGAKVFFTTSEQLSSQDLDEDADIYMRDLAAGATELSSPPPGLCPVSSCDVVFSGISTDGAHVVFQTEERLSSEDIDSEVDVYERSEGETRIVSAGNSATLGPATPVLERTDPLSPGESITPKIIGQADGDTLIKIYATSDCSGAPVATGTSLELGGAGIAVTVPAGSTTSFRATATDTIGDTSPCSLPVSYTQQSAPPPPDPPPPPPPDPGTGTGGAGSGTGTGSTGGLPQFHSGGIAFVTPEAQITFGPAFKTRKRRAVFRFFDATGQPGTRFICKRDRRRWRSCGSPALLKGLRPGKHVFAVKAVNAAGAWQARPVKREFKVVR
jgi:Tol biopolymer transport system component